MVSIKNSKEAVEEWCIPFKDLEFKEIMRQGRYGNVYR